MYLILSYLTHNQQSMKDLSYEKSTDQEVSDPTTIATSFNDYFVSIAENIKEILFTTVKQAFF